VNGVQVGNEQSLVIRGDRLGISLIYVSVKQDIDRDEDFAHVASMDRFALDYMEQPLHYEDLDRHAALAKTLATPICLDESIRSAADTRLALALGSCRVVNVKLGRVGGYSEALRDPDAVRAAGVPLWCGGMLEAGVGRAHNVALASLPPSPSPGTRRRLALLRGRHRGARARGDGRAHAVPKGPGIGVELRRMSSRGSRARGRAREPWVVKAVSPSWVRTSPRGGRLLADLRALVEIESPSDDAAAVTAVAAYVHERLTAVGVPAERIACRVRATRCSRVRPCHGRTLVLSHIGTVWPWARSARFRSR
jgi:hypothetical protein